MTSNGEMAPILRYFTEFGSFRGALRKSGCMHRLPVRLQKVYHNS